MGQAQRTSSSGLLNVSFHKKYKRKVKKILPKEREHLARKERKSCPKPNGGKILLREMDGKSCKKDEKFCLQG